MFTASSLLKNWLNVTVIASLQASFVKVTNNSERYRHHHFSKFEKGQCTRVATSVNNGNLFAGLER